MKSQIKQLEKEISEKNNENQLLLGQSGNKTLLYYKNMIEQSKDLVVKLKMAVIEKNEEMLNLNQVSDGGDVVEREARVNCISFGENSVNGTIIQLFKDNKSLQTMLQDIHADFIKKMDNLKISYESTMKNYSKLKRKSMAQ